MAETNKDLKESYWDGEKVQTIETEVSSDDSDKYRTIVEDPDLFLNNKIDDLKLDVDNLIAYVDDELKDKVNNNYNCTKKLKHGVAKQFMNIQDAIDANVFIVKILSVLSVALCVTVIILAGTTVHTMNKVEDQKKLMHKQESQITDLRDRLDLLENNFDVHVESDKAN